MKLCANVSRIVGHTNLKPDAVDGLTDPKYRKNPKSSEGIRQYNAQPLQNA